MHVEKIMVVNSSVSASCMTCSMAKQALYSIAMVELVTTQTLPFNAKWWGKS